MKARNIVGKIYVSPMPIWGVLKHFVEDFKLQFIFLIGGLIGQINCNLSKKHQYKNSGPCHSVMTQAAFVVILLFTLYKL